MKSGLVLGLAFVSVLPGLVLGHSLTYVSSFGAFDADGKVVNLPLTNNVTMTVTLYASEESEDALWSRRLTVPVYDGGFVIELSDRLGVMDESVDVRYRLDALFANMKPDGALWVQVSDPRVDGKPIGDGTVLKRGKITGVPFAVLAQRAARASGSFRVRGKATLSSLTARGSVTVRDKATFKDKVTFADEVQFGQTLTVTGLLQRAFLDNVGTFAAESLTADGVVSVGGQAKAALAMLTPSSSPKVPSCIHVTEALSADKPITVDLAEADRIACSGQTTLSSQGRLVLRPLDGASVAVPDGVYGANSQSAAEYRSLKDFSYKNASAHHGFCTLVTSAFNDCFARMKLSDDVNGISWAQMGIGLDGIGIATTSLVLLRPGETVSVSCDNDHATLQARTFKELSK